MPQIVHVQCFFFFFWKFKDFPLRTTFNKAFAFFNFLSFFFWVICFFRVTHVVCLV